MAHVDHGIAGLLGTAGCDVFEVNVFEAWGELPERGDAVEVLRAEPAGIDGDADDVHVGVTDLREDFGRRFFRMVFVAEDEAEFPECGNECSPVGLDQAGVAAIKLADVATGPVGLEQAGTVAEDGNAQRGAEPAGRAELGDVMPNPPA